MSFAATSTWTMEPRRSKLAGLHVDMALPVCVVEECERNLYCYYHQSSSDEGREGFAAYPQAMEYAR